VRVEDLDIRELLELDPEGGVIRFAGQRALLLDAVALGLLRKYLTENFGQAAARTVLTQFGFAHGWRMAEALREQFPWESVDDWRKAGARLYTLGGLFRVEPRGRDALSPEGVMLLESYEAEQHLSHFGRADTPICWTLSGLLSGYLSQTVGQETYVLEDRCVARGDAACHFAARSRELWGEERAEELGYFATRRLDECLDDALLRVTATLKESENKLHVYRTAFQEAPPDPQEPFGLVARSSAMRHTIDLARRMARVDSTVLITGESGVGKERIARLVHAESKRATGPFIAVNCGAITETLLESELFGHKRGAFTGATEHRAGLFEAATGGTLLLDEIGDITPGMQVKLLRVLQEHEVRRVGENNSRAVDVRLLAATNRDLGQQVASGNFRQDLYYRIKVVDLQVPALRERREDIMVLARLLLHEAATRMKRTITGLTPAAADQLLRYRWPGNVRELENAMECAVALARGMRIELEDLPEDVREAAPRPLASADHPRRLEEIEKQHILAVLDSNEGNQTRSAEQLGIGSATLYRKLKGYGMTTSRSTRPPKAAS
jgi:two-component system response regulator HydG